MDILGPNEPDCSGLDLGDSPFDLAFPIDIGASIAFRGLRVQKLFCQAGAILRRQRLGSGRQFFD